jgi:hypothetical protein
MKKLIAILLVVVLACTIFAGCVAEKEICQEETRVWVMLRLPDGTIITGERGLYSGANGVVSIWIDDTKYTTHYSNVAIITESGSQ